MYLYRTRVPPDGKRDKRKVVGVGKKGEIRCGWALADTRKRDVGFHEDMHGQEAWMSVHTPKSLDKGRVVRSAATALYIHTIKDELPERPVGRRPRKVQIPNAICSTAATPHVRPSRNCWYF